MPFSTCARFVSARRRVGWGRRQVAPRFRRSSACGPVHLARRQHRGWRANMESKALDRIAKRYLIVLQVFALSRSAAGGVGCSTETGSDAGKVSLRASSSAFSWCVRSRLSRALTSRSGLRFTSAITSSSPTTLPLARRRQQRAFAPPLPPPCAAHLAIAAQSRADPDRDR